MEYLQSDGSQVWVAPTRSSVVWLGWLVAALILDHSSVSPCSLPISYERLLLMVRGVKAHKRPTDFVVREGESQRYLFTNTDATPEQRKAVSECTSLCHSGVATLCDLQQYTTEAGKRGICD